MNGRVYESDVEAHIKNARLPNNPDLQKKSAQFFLDLAQKAGKSGLGFMPHLLSIFCFHEFSFDISVRRRMHPCSLGW